MSAPIAITEIGRGIGIGLAETGNAMDALQYASLLCDNLEAALTELSTALWEDGRKGGAPLQPHGLTACLANLADVAKAAVGAAMAEVKRDQAGTREASRSRGAT